MCNKKYNLKLFNENALIKERKVVISEASNEQRCVGWKTFTFKLLIFFIYRFVAKCRVFMHYYRFIRTIVMIVIVFNMITFIINDNIF